MTKPAPPEVTAETAAPVIALHGVHVRLGGQEVLRGVDLEVRQGEFLALIGPSGGGKSTLLRVIGGLLGADKAAQAVQTGTVRVAEPPAFVFQDYRLLPWRSVLGNVSLPRQLHGRGLDPQEALTQVGMQAFGRYYPAQLSGGMRARVALARALAQSSDILLLDEPFAALDALVRERFNEELKHLHDKTGRTTVLVTHSIREAVYLADRVAVLRGGQIVQILDTAGLGRVSAYTDGLEAELRGLLGTGDSTKLLPVAAARRGWLERLAPLAALLLGLLVWQLAAAAISNTFLLPTPAQVWGALAGNLAYLGTALYITGRTALLGGLLGGIFGAALGYPLAKLPWLERFASPFVVASQSTPIVVLAPLLVSYLGFGLLPSVVVAALTALYPVLVATLVGVREVDKTYQELFSTLRARPWQRLRHLDLPGALPVMLGGLRLSVSLALIGAVVWEFTDANQKGLGFAVAQAGNVYNKPLQFAAILVLVLFGVALYGLVTALERRALRHRGRG